MKSLLAALVCVFAGFAPALGQDGHAHDGQAHEGHDHMHAHYAPACDRPVPACGVTATPTFAPDGRLWLTYAVRGIVYAAASSDHGHTFDTPVAINAQPLDLDDNGEARPKLIVLPNGNPIVTFGVRRDMDYNGTLMLSRSLDGGHAFLPPAPILDEANQRFDTLGVAPDGRIYMAWLDKRHLKDAKAHGEAYPGSGFALAWSDDGGANFSGKQILVDHTCECCRIAMSFDRDGRPVFAWRQVFGKNTRDHMAAKFADDTSNMQQIRVSEDDWAVDVCPHHGPSLAVDPAGAWHIVWFTGGSKRKGLFYAQHDPKAPGFSPPEAFGNADHAPSHPQILATQGRLIRAWKEFDGTTTSIFVQMSKDAGTSWSSATSAALTTDASDHPILISDGKKPYLSWLTRKEGYRLIPLAVESER